MKSKISVIIVTWNSEDEIVECLKSLVKFRSTKYDYEIIVVDNMSSDKTVQIIKDLKLADCRIFALNENTGFAKGNNYGLAKSTGDYTMLLNPDTILLEDVFVKMVDALSNEKNGLIGCKLLNADLTLQPSAFNFETPFNILMDNLRIASLMPKFIKDRYFPNYSLMSNSKKVDWVIGAAMLLRTSEFRQINGLSEDYFMYTEDMDLCKKVLNELNKFTYFEADVSMIHLGGRSEIKNVNYVKSDRLIKNKIKFLSKFYSISTTRRGVAVLRVSYMIKLVIAYGLRIIRPTLNNKNQLKSIKSTLLSTLKVKSESI